MTSYNVIERIWNFSFDRPYNFPGLDLVFKRFHLLQGKLRYVILILINIYPIHIRIIHFPKESELFYFLRGFYLYLIVLNGGEFGNTLSLTCLWRFNGTIRGIFIYLKGNTDIWKNLHDDFVLDYKSCVQWTVKKICTINVEWYRYACRAFRADK